MRSSRGRIACLSALVTSAGLIAWGTAQAATPGTFQPVGDLIEARSSLGATLLDDGSVLVTGGEGGPPCWCVVRTVERFDPATNTFTRVTPMTGIRSVDASVRLADGRVLLLGGVVP